MSEERLPDVLITVKLRSTSGKKLATFCKFELFEAAQFESNINIREKNFHPMPPGNPIKRKEWLKNYFRVRVDGSWLRTKSAKYALYEQSTCWARLEDLLKDEANKKA